MRNDNEKIIVHHVEIAKTSLNLSGGEKAAIEIIDFLFHKGCKNIIYTSESGRILFKKLKDFSKIEFVEIGAFKWEKINPYFAYYLRFFQLFLHLKKFKEPGKHIILTHSDFVPSTLYSFLLKLINPQSKWFLIFHMKCPDLFKGYLGEFTHKFYFPNLRLIRYWLEQRITFFLTKKVDRIITINVYNFRYLIKFYPEKKIYILKNFGGLNCTKIEKEKKYDLIFIGRFHPQKGYLDLLKIVKKCKKVLPNMKLLVIGGGDKVTENNFRSIISQENLSSNIFYKGYISGDKKYHYLAQSKIFIMPSYYESFGIVILEALNFGVPVVAYDLPVYSVFGNNIIKVNIGDIEKISSIIVNYLTEKKKYLSVSRQVAKFSKNIRWDKTGEEVYNLIIN